MVVKREFYLYHHIRLDKNQVFYVGIGTKPINSKEKSFSRAFSSNKRNLFWKRIVEKTNYKVVIIEESNNYSYIKEREIEEIKLYGKRSDGGNLCNITDGGDGTVGFSRTDEVNKLISSKISGKGNRKSLTCYQYSLHGILIRKYDSFNIAATLTGLKKQNILACKDSFGKCGNFYWSDVLYDNYIVQCEGYINKLSKPKNHFYKSITATNIMNKIIFPSIISAAEHFTGNKFNRSNIKKSLSGKKDMVYGYKFTYTV